MTSKLQSLFLLFNINNSDNQNVINHKLSFGVIPELVANNDLESLLELSSMGHQLKIIREYLLIGKTVPIEIANQERVEEYKNVLKNLAVNITDYYLADLHPENIQASELFGKINPKLYIEFVIYMTNSDKCHLYYAKRRGISLPNNIPEHLFLNHNNRSNELIIDLFPDQVNRYIPTILIKATGDLNEDLITKCLKIYPDYKEIVQKVKYDIFLTKLNNYMKDK